MKKLTLFFVALATLAFVTIFSNNAFAAGNGKNKNTAPCDTIFVRVPCDSSSQVAAPGFGQQNQSAPAAAATPATAPTTTVAASTSDSLLAKLIKRVEALEKRPQPNTAGLSSRISGLESLISGISSTANSAENAANATDGLVKELTAKSDTIQADIAWLARKVKVFQELDESIDTRFIVTWIILAILALILLIVIKNIYSNLGKVTEQTDRLQKAFLKRNEDAEGELFPKKKPTQQPQQQPQQH